jgi:hypothetical protein
VRLHGLLVSNTRAAITTALYAESVRRFTAAARDYRISHGLNRVTPDEWFAAIDAGQADISAGEAVLELGAWLMSLPEDHHDLAVLASVFPIRLDREFPSPDTQRLLQTWATEAATIETEEELLAKIAEYETSAALDAELHLPLPFTDRDFEGAHH